jgi:hypothetical protein
MDGMYAGFAGAKACHEKIRINRGALDVFLNSIRLAASPNLY